MVRHCVHPHVHVLYHEPCRAAGRAGNKGTAITFIAVEDDKFAPDLVKALKESAAPIPKDLQALADGFAEKRKAGTVQAHGTGYGGSGFKFDTTEEEERKAARKVCSTPLMRPCPACSAVSALCILLPSMHVTHCGCLFAEFEPPRDTALDDVCFGWMMRSCSCCSLW